MALWYVWEIQRFYPGMLDSILAAYGLQKDKCLVTPFGSGLINHTWKVENGQAAFILQHINDGVFKNPRHIAANMALLSRYLKTAHPKYLFVTPICSVQGEELVLDTQEGWFRLLPFVSGSFTYDVVTNTNLAYEAARQFGRFTHLLSHFDAAQLQLTLPHFHNLFLRYRQFEEALRKGDRDRICAAKESIQFINNRWGLVETYERLKKNSHFKIRVTHHDTKISNVLFDERGTGLCVIDLDTAMPGYFISDVGDMMRTYLSPVSEETADFSKIEIREDYFRAIATGYLGEMAGDLTPEEKVEFVFAGKFMIYMQALRFLTDYINNDVYYGAQYEGHNLVRAINQIVLLQRLEEKETLLAEIVKTVSGTGL